MIVTVRLTNILLALTLAASMLGFAIVAHHYFRTMPHPSEAGVPGYTKTASAPIQTLNYGDFARTPGEDELQFARRITSAVNMSTYHCDPPDYSLSWLERVAWRIVTPVPPFDQGILVRERFDCGFCHQRAFLAHQILQNAGIQAAVWGLNGHVVVRFVSAGQSYFTDPDYGVGPFPTFTEDYETTVRQAYAGAVMENADVVVPMYLSGGDNQAYPIDLDSRYVGQLAVFRLAHCMALVLAAGSALLGFTAAFLLLRGVAI